MFTSKLGGIFSLILEECDLGLELKFDREKFPKNNVAFAYCGGI